MTDDMLRLARAVYPDKPWQVDEERTIPFLGNGMYFYPEHFDSQFIDTLAWLTRQTCIDWHKPDCNAIGGEHQIVLCDYDGETFDHDGTASGIRAAVVEAARRVATR